jgi:hypothetical protein
MTAPVNHNQPPSEQYRLAALDWVEKDSAARMLEEAKTAILSQHMKSYGDIPAAHSEREVKASDQWHDYIRKMVSARTAANKAKVEMEYRRMLFSEWMSADATKRAEMRL